MLSELFQEVYNFGFKWAGVVVLVIFAARVLNLIYLYGSAYINDRDVEDNFLSRMRILWFMPKGRIFSPFIEMLFGMLLAELWLISVVILAGWAVLKVLRMTKRLSKLAHEHKEKKIVKFKDKEWRG